jgi:tetratricopeptide (TPR) repeat protein
MLRRAAYREGNSMAVYDAFVSYSHAKDKPIAAALQSAIQRLGKPWYRRRALRVFRDDTSLSATPTLWPSIEKALGNSRFLIVLASPEAAASPWVNKEISWWLDNKSTDTILIALTGGELTWGNAVGDFVWREDMPLPPVLTGRFASEPKWVDLRAYRDGANPRDVRFIEAGADFAAAIHDMPKDDLLSQEVRQQKRALTLAWTAATSLLCLAILAGWQWKVAIDNERSAIEQRNIAEEQRQLAQAQRDRAERTLATATETANSLVVDLAREFRERAGVPRDFVRRILDRALVLQQQLAKAGESTPELRDSEAVTLGDLVEMLLALGDTTAALDAARSAQAITAELVAAEPDNTRRQSNLAAGHNQIGDVLMATGRREEALTEYRRSLAVREKLAAADPANTEWQRDLVSSHLRIGDALFAAGRRNEALAEFRRALAIGQKLAATDPANASWHRDLAVSHERIGDVHFMAQQWEDALAEYRQGLAIREKFAAAIPENTEWRRALAVSYAKIADVLKASDRLEEAMVEYRRGHSLVERLAANDAGNMQWQRHLSVSHGRIGDVLREAGRREEALAEYSRGLAISEKLVATDPDNSQWQTDLVVRLHRISAVSDETQARASLRRAIEIADALAKSGALTAAQTSWPQLLRDDLAALSPETAEAR